MPNQSHVPDDREIASALKHEISDTPGEGPIVRRSTEKRDIREAEWIQFQDMLHQDPLAATPEDTHSLLFTSANRHLRAVGDMDFFSVMDTAERLSPEGYPSAEKISQHFELWAGGMKIRKGLLSVDTIAARFIQAQDRLFTILYKNPAMQEAAFAYADAWHWLHQELFGEHELAASAQVAEQAAEKATAGLKSGSAAARRKAALRSAVIEVEYHKFARLPGNEMNRKSAKRSAERILADVSLSLAKQKLSTITESNLGKAAARNYCQGMIERKIRPVFRRDVRGSDNPASSSVARFELFSKFIDPQPS
jgi:hypothetical protein